MRTHYIKKGGGTPNVPARGPTVSLAATDVNNDLFHSRKLSVISWLPEFNMADVKPEVPILWPLFSILHFSNATYKQYIYSIILMFHNEN